MIGSKIFKICKKWRKNSIESQGKRKRSLSFFFHFFFVSIVFQKCFQVCQKRGSRTKSRPISDRVYRTPLMANQPRLKLKKKLINFSSARKIEILSWRENRIIQWKTRRGARFEIYFFLIFILFFLFYFTFFLCVRRP